MGVMTTDKLTADTITDDQIQKLKVEAAAAGDDEMYAICGLAGHPGQGHPCEPLPTDVAYKARQRCADAINNARAQDGAS
jgi:hypothetical protein